MKITLKELQQHIRRGPGLVCGPGLTTSLGREAECLKHIKSLFPELDKDSACHSFLDYVDLILAAGLAPEQKIRTEVQSAFLNSTFASPQLHAVVKVNWTAIVSLACDEFCKVRFTERLYAEPTKWTVTTVAEPATILPLTTKPFYALMGDVRDNRENCSLAISRSQYLKRLRVWTSMLQSLPNILKGDPLIFLGTSTIVERVCDFMNELLKLNPRIPRKLIFLEGDPIAESATFRNLVREFCEIDTANCSLTDLGNALSKSSLTINSLPLFVEPTKSLIDPRAFADIEDQVCYVPRREEVHANPAERNRLLDSLFRPSHLDWAPYSLHLEFNREVCSVAEAVAKNILAAPPTIAPRILDLKGEAGIGKTVVMRSLAFSLAQQNILCLWIKRSYGEISGNRFDAVVASLSDAIRRPNSQVVFFLDDPAGSRVKLHEVISALRRAKFQWLIVVASRRTDEAVLNKDGIAQTIPAENSLEVPAEFTATEISKLPEYLVTLGVAETLEKAKSMMLPPGVQHSKDVLCSLWYLLPQTQSAIEESLVGEFHRLGEAETIVKRFVSAAGGTKSFAKAAYEFVTTTSGFNSTSLPVEVLVSALGISYSEWAAQCHEKKPLWGLLYEEDYPSAETYGYRTRNYIVTEIVLRTLNHGTAGHTGEFRCLKKLLAACTSSSPQYRAFIQDILVERRSLIEKRFSYEQAMELYETAISAYPKSLGVVEHHKCLVKRRLKGDSAEVYDDLRKLIVKSYDRSIPDQDSPDNLHTSAAATMNQMIKEEKVEAVEGGESVFEHVTAALAIDQFSLHSHHVHAQSLMTVAGAVRNTNHSAFMANLERAARIVSRALLLMENTMTDDLLSGSPSESKRLFQDLREDVLLAQPDIEGTQRQAVLLFEKAGDQTALGFVARMLLTKATQDKKGQLFKKTDEFLRQCFKLVEGSGKEPKDELLLCRIELIIHWFLNQSKGPVYWEQFESDLTFIIKNPRYAQDAIWLFYLGVAHYNQHKFVEAEACFQTLRSRNLPWEIRQKIRTLYIGDKSDPQIFEGKIYSGAQDHRFIYSAELENDILVRRGDLSGRPDEVKHFKIGFTFYGPLAVDRQFLL